MLLSELDTALESSRSTITPCPSDEAAGEVSTRVMSAPARLEHRPSDDIDSGLFDMDPEYININPMNFQGLINAMYRPIYIDI